MAVVEDPLDCLVTHCVVLAAGWCGGSGGGFDMSCPEALEVLDQAWDGLVDQVAAACQVVEVHPLGPVDPSRHRPDSRRIGERLMNG